MNKKNGRQVISTKFVEQLNDSPLDLLTAPIAIGKYEEKKLNGKSSLKHLLHLSEDTRMPKRTTFQPKERITVQINQNTIERVKDCVYWNRLTIAQFVEEALEVALKAAETENGKPFQKRRSELKPGRPTK